MSSLRDVKTEQLVRAPMGKENVFIRVFVGTFLKKGAAVREHQLEGEKVDA